MNNLSDQIYYHTQSDMPNNRKNLKHIKITYDDEQNAQIQAHPLNEKEQSILNHFEIPPQKSKILLHSCCAPCSGAMVEEMLYKMNLDVTIFFYNPNIHPKQEYEIRKEENKRHAIKLNIPFVDCDYDSESWFQRMVGFELEPERGVRCSACFDMRMEVTASYAFEHKFEYFTTTNATSRWKDVNQVNISGIRAAKNYFPLKFWVYNWQSDEMTKRKYEVSVNEKFYKQEYCGCSYSLRDSNIWRAQQGIPQVIIGGETAGLGTRYFENVITDEQEESWDVVNTFFKDANQHFGNQNRAIKHKEKVKIIQKNDIYDGRSKSTSNTQANNW